MRRMIVSVFAVLLCASLSTTAEASAARKKGDKSEPAKPAEPAAPKEPIVPVLKLGDEAPTFTLKPYNPQGKGIAMVSLGNLVGPDAEDKESKLVLVSFGASWCAPCKKEMPFLQTLHEKYGPQGLRVLLVSIDKEEAGQAAMKGLVEEHKLTLPVLMDRFNMAAKRWLGDKAPLPSVFLVDRQGKIAMASYGYGEDASTFLEKSVTERLAAAGATK